MVSPMVSAVTPKSAARAKSGRTISSGRVRLALEVTFPMPGRVRRSRAALLAASLRATGSSLFSTRIIFTPLSAGPTVRRTPGWSAKRSRISLSTACCLRSRSVRWLKVTLSTARRTSATTPGAKASPPAPPPTELITLFTSGIAAMMVRARSAAAQVSLKVLPGGSSMLTMVCERSAGGTKPVGSSGISITEPTKKAMAASSVTKRWVKPHCMALI